ncbi:LysR family transcriptional regulator [Clostridium estertheticum]|uniref:LysR family transcriptional regulator n=1 Tax=Clostridium estertheticum TaxID=238834 RepID=UPI001CF31380|nr:LysR family transcriptional regulator [Clostridium estertheticum]MCB2355715.1 LysR family transcriptional regulator [Clostridium estertheticum]
MRFNEFKKSSIFPCFASLEYYTRAAITQPSLTYAISELEKELETHLFEKQGRNVYLQRLA